MGYLYLILAQLSIGINVVVVKLLLPVMDIYTYTCLRFLVGASLITLLILFKRQKFYQLKNPDHPLNVQDKLGLVGQALTGGLLFNIIFYEGIKYTTATSAAIVGSSLPAILAVMAYVFLKEKLTKNNILGLLLTIVGILFLSLDNIFHQHATSAKDALLKEGSFFGDFIILLSMFPEAYYSILVKKQRNRLEYLSNTFVLASISFLMFVPFALLHFHEVAWNLVTFKHLFLIFLGGSTTFIFYLFWNKGLETVSTNKAALFIGIFPISTTILAVLFLGEVFTYADFFGLIFVLFAIYIGRKK